MQKTCSSCSSGFEITKEDLAYYDRISPVIGGKKHQVPPPTLCPDCRQQRRAAHLNELKLYKRSCDLTGKMIVSNFHPDNRHVVYDQAKWYSDAWDPLSYAQDVDFSRPFFGQYKELCDAVPHPSLFTGYQYD